MKRILAIVLVGGLIGGLAYAPAIAKKKPKPKPKPKQVSVDYFMHRDACGTDADVTSLSVEDGEDGGNACGSPFAGAGNEFFIQIGDVPLSDIWAATDGIPFTLDASKDITGQITVSSFKGDPANPASLGAGEATLEVVLTGTSGGEVKTIGTGSTTYTVTPDQTAYTSDFTITPDAALDKVLFESLELTTTLRGPAVLHAFYELEDPASFFTIPTWVKKKK
jgi:hypothetical protein